MKKGVNAVIRRDDNKLLLQLRDDGRGKDIPYKNMWSFFGGHVELDETPIDTVVREVNEETNFSLTSRDCTLITSYIHDSFESHVYYCDVKNTGNLVLKEGKDYGWFSLDEIKQLSLAWHQNEILPAIEEYLGSNIIHPPRLA